MRNLFRLSALASAVLLAGCTTTYVSPVEVTRFTGDQPQALGSGPIAVRAGPTAPPDSLELNVFRDAVARELQEQGYVVINGEAPQVAEVTIDLFAEQPGYNNSPVSVGGGVAGGSYGSSAGVGVGIDLTPRPSERLHRELRVMIKPAEGGTALWEGRARFTATVNSDFAETQAAATKLADALFGGFPGQSGETIEVE
jgi:hypothetical protein